MPALPSCPSASAIDVSDVEAAVANADVQAALAAPPTMWFGLNAPDAPAFTFTRDAGGQFAVGLDCASGDMATSCVPPPPGVSALVVLLRALNKQQLADPSCAGLH